MTPQSAAVSIPIPIPIPIYKLSPPVLKAIFGEESVAFSISGRWATYQGIKYNIPVDPIKERMRKIIMRKIAK